MKPECILETSKKLLRNVILRSARLTDAVGQEATNAEGIPWENLVFLLKFKNEIPHFVRNDKTKMVFQMFLLFISIIFSGCAFFSSNNYPPLETVASVDVKKYIGKWYEIASLPFFQQNGCACTTAEYEILEDGVLKVTNTCKKGEKTDQAIGKAFVVEGTNNAKLKVQFFWPFKGDYWIIDLAEDYSYAVVGVPSRKYCWILSRTTTMEEQTYNAILARIKAKGFDITRFNKTVHNCL